MTITVHTNLDQGSQMWLDAKCGILSASKMADIITPSTLKFADNKTSRELVDTIALQRLTKFVEPEFQSYDMRRGQKEETLAREVYNKNYAPVTEVGFVTNDRWGFTLGWSPDGLVGDDGCVEFKSKKQKLQFAIVRSGKMPDEFKFQVQTGMLVGARNWCDFGSYSGGLNMMTLRIEPDLDTQQAILDAALKFEDKVKIAIEEYGNKIADKTLRIVPVPPTPEDDEIIT